MSSLDRRQFLESVVVAGAAAFAGLRPLQAADAVVDVDPSQPGPVISPHLYGHFIEHLGGVIYDGIWVGRDSKIPNVGGIRKQFVDDMKRIGAPNLRWPGGCFADGYHWRDGIGAAHSGRARTTTGKTACPQGRHAVERNEFGIHEFMRLCRLVGAEPYLAANVGSGTPQEFHDWVSYSNAPAGTLSLADERAAQRRQGAVQRQVLGRGQRIVGLRRQHDRRRIRHRYRKYISQFPVYLQPVLRGDGAARALRRWRRRLDRGLLRRDCRTCADWASGWTALRCTTTPTSVRPPKTARRSTRRAGTPCCTRARTSRT